jgi:DNA helicase HerA-like ATPase
LRIRTMTSDTRMNAIVGGMNEDENLLTWLEKHLGSGAQSPSLVVLDLSFVPSEIIHMVAGVTARVVFEALQRYKRLTGLTLPTVLVLEEAHHFLQHEFSEERWAATPAGFCKGVFDKIAREGRKYGLGLVLSSQRPAELSATTLSQCNTFLIHRTVNDRDQNLISRLVPDNVSGLIGDLPSLPTQHAILVGWATTIPLLVEMRSLTPEQRPTSSDPPFWKVWIREEPRTVDWTPIVERWTGVSLTDGQDESAIANRATESAADSSAQTNLNEERPG